MHLVWTYVIHSAVDSRQSGTQIGRLHCTKEVKEVITLWTEQWTTKHAGTLPDVVCCSASFTASVQPAANPIGLHSFAFSALCYPHDV